jgi:hypothetical protein
MRKIILAFMAIFVMTAVIGCQHECCKNGHCTTKK